MSQVSKTQMLPLEENHDIIQRSVSGKLMVHYKWTPYESDRDYDARVLKGVSPKVCAAPQAGEMDKDPEEDSSVGTFDLRGKLDITIIHAEGLIDLDCSHAAQQPNLFCVVMVFPKNLRGRAGLVPTVWCTPSVTSSRRATHPCCCCWKHNCVRWMVNKSFNYKWCTPRVVEDNWDKEKELKEGQKTEVGENTDEIEKSMMLFVDKIKRLGQELRRVKESVHGLANRVDMLANEEE